MATGIARWCRSVCLPVPLPVRRNCDWLPGGFVERCVGGWEQLELPAVMDLDGVIWNRNGGEGNPFTGDDLRIEMISADFRGWLVSVHRR
jgi:hypothetical protein